MPLQFHWFVHKGFRKTDELLVDLIHEINLYITRANKKKESERIEKVFVESLNQITHHIDIHSHIFKTTNYVIKTLEKETQELLMTSEKSKEKKVLKLSIDAQRELLNQINISVMKLHEARNNIEEMFTTFKARDPIEKARVKILCQQLEEAVGVKYRNS